MKYFRLCENMPDIMSKEKRSRVMSHIRGKWTQSETMIHHTLKGLKIKHKMYPKIDGNPDVLIKDTNTAIFIDGCFWHGCPRCYKEPQSNTEYWLPKIMNNKKRDKRNTRRAKAAGFRVKRIWEHQIQKKGNKKMALGMISRYIISL